LRGVHPTNQSVVGKKGNQPGTVKQRGVQGRGPLDCRIKQRKMVEKGRKHGWQGGKPRKGPTLEEGIANKKRKGVWKGGHGAMGGEGRREKARKRLLSQGTPGVCVKRVKKFEKTICAKRCHG